MLATSQAGFSSTSEHYSPSLNQRSSCSGSLGSFTILGHYPFSHATEFAIRDHYASRVGETRFFMHEALGKALIEGDAELSAVLTGHGVAPKDVADIITHTSLSPLANLVSSDLDADRMDYLLRTAHHTGLPYGSVDISYLIGQLRFDNMKRVCVDPRALRTVDHFLLCRYFDYQQVTYHKTVAAMEMVLKAVVVELLRAEIIDCTRDAIERAIAGSTWASFDDAYLASKIRTLEAETSDPSVKTKTNCILRRKPPVLVGDKHFLADSSARTVSDFRNSLKIVRKAIPELATRFGIPADLWYAWSSDSALTKVASTIPVEDAADGDVEGIEESVRVFDHLTGSSKAIVALDRSLMAVLSQRKAYGLRLYVLETGLSGERRDEIRKYVRDHVDAGW